MWLPRTLPGNERAFCAPGWKSTEAGGLASTVSPPGDSELRLECTSAGISPGLQPAWEPSKSLESRQAGD